MALSRDAIPNRDPGDLDMTEYMTVTEVAGYFGTSESTIKRRIGDGTLFENIVKVAAEYGEQGMYLMSRREIEGLELRDVSPKAHRERAVRERRGDTVAASTRSRVRALEARVAVIERHLLHLEAAAGVSIPPARPGPSENA